MQAYEDVKGQAGDQDYPSLDDLTSVIAERDLRLDDVIEQSKNGDCYFHYPKLPWSEPFLIYVAKLYAEPFLDFEDAPLTLQIFDMDGQHIRDFNIKPHPMYTIMVESHLKAVTGDWMSVYQKLKAKPSFVTPVESNPLRAYPIMIRGLLGDPEIVAQYPEYALD